MKQILLLIIFAGILLSCNNKPIQLFTAKEVQTAEGVTLLTLNQNALHELRTSGDKEIEMPIFGGKTVVLQLTEQTLFTNDFVVRTSDNVVVPYTPGKHYTGGIKGEANSIASLSVFNDEVQGIVSTSAGDFNLGQISQSTDYALAYTVGNPDFVCLTPDEGIDAEEIKALIEKGEVNINATNTCVSVDFEMSYSDFQQFGSVASVTNWITSIFASVKTVYANEGITIVIKSIFVHTSPDGYDPNPSTALNQLRAKRTGDPNFTGSVVHFVRGKTGGFSGIAYVGVTCLDSYQYGLSDVSFTYSPYPTYSWTIMVLCHEMGHNFGSNHTQSCTWPGGAIDNCYTTEGGCPPGPAPINGGTIMSYCHMTSYGIKLPNGFGPLPGAAIRSHIGGTTCASCGTPPPPPPPVDLCKNGKIDPGELGIDCGGVCPNPCIPVPPSGDPLISQGRPASQSSSYMPNTNPYPAIRVNDGLISPNNFNHTLAEINPWIEIDLGAKYKVTRIEITNRTGCPSCVGRLKNFRISITDAPLTAYPQSPSEYFFDYSNAFGMGDGEIVNKPNMDRSGRYIRLYANNGTTPNYLHIAEIRLWGTPVTVVPCVWRDTIYKIVRDSVGKICR